MQVQWPAQCSIMRPKEHSNVYLRCPRSQPREPLHVPQDSELKPPVADSQASPGELRENLLVSIEDALIMLVSPVNNMLHRFRQA